MLSFKLKQQDIKKNRVCNSLNERFESIAPEISLEKPSAGFIFPNFQRDSYWAEQVPIPNNYFKEKNLYICE